LKMLISQPLIKKYLNGYKSLIRRLMFDPSLKDEKNLVYWQNRLFTIAISYALPISLLVVTFCIVLEINTGHKYIAILDFVAISLFVSIALNQKIVLHWRKILVSLLMVLLAISMMAFTGALVTGFVYLFSVSIFISLQFSDKLSFGSIGLNFLICAAFAIIIYFQPFELKILYQSAPLDRWIIYSTNFLFMNLVAVILIRQLLNGLDQTMVKEIFLLKELRKEVDDRNKRDDLLKESELHYKALFFQSPLPKWIIDAETLQFLQVNEATVKIYGYTENEFLNMTLHDIHHSEKMEEFIKTNDSDQADKSFVTRQITKSGEEIDVEFRSTNLQFEGKAVRLVIATDITQQIKYNREMELKNRKLKEIAYMQSHVIRVPLANIMGLSDLLVRNTKTHEERQLFNHLDTSVKQLDHVINEIVRRAADSSAEL
ncbi:MAG: PAS domain S-box protein, partial [Pedobacter sp.]